MSHAHHDPVAQRKEYFKVFGYLIALTVLEVAFVFLPLPKFIITLLVVIASCAKAGLVGYYYMHLKQETLWLKVVACLPIVMFVYLAVLGPDSKQRPVHVYFFEPPRVLPVPHHQEKAEAQGESPARVAERELLENAAKRAAAEKATASGVAPTTPAPTAAAAGATAPAAGAGAAGTGESADDFR